MARLWNLALIAVAIAHIGAGLNHLWIKKDQVFDRIWFKSQSDDRFS